MRCARFTCRNLGRPFVGAHHRVAPIGWSDARSDGAGGAGEAAEAASGPDATQYMAAIARGKASSESPAVNRE